MSTLWYSIVMGLFMLDTVRAKVVGCGKEKRMQSVEFFSAREVKINWIDCEATLL